LRALGDDTSSRAAGGRCGSPARREERVVDLHLEVVVVPVTDVDRAKDFYGRGLACREDADVSLPGGYRCVQMTPPGSACSIIFGTGVTEARPGTLDGLLLAVDDIEEARRELADRGIDVSEIFHDADGGLAGGLRADVSTHAPGLDPERRSYASYAHLRDPDGNRWLLQQVTERLPGRVTTDVAELADLLHETSEQHEAFEAVAPPHDWWDWYAAYLGARQRGLAPGEAATAAERHMAEVEHVVVGTTG
jgi:catechol 2,3-dioxygenase-like lactoylglutathione lyase family enzyme